MNDFVADYLVHFYKVHFKCDPVPLLHKTFSFFFLLLLLFVVVVLFRFVSEYKDISTQCQFLSVCVCIKSSQYV